MPQAVKKTISLPHELADEVREIAEETGQTVSGVIQEGIRVLKQERLKKNFREMQSYWSSKAKEKGILSETDLKKLLK